MKIKILKKIVAMTKFGFYGFLLQCISFSFLIADNGMAQQKSVFDIYLSVQIEQGKLIDAFKLIENETGFNFSYNDAIVKENKHISLNMPHQSLGDVLGQLSKNTNLKFKRVNQNIHVSAKQIFQNSVSEIVNNYQEIVISGIVTSEEDGLELPGVNILVKGTSFGTVTDVQGRFKISVPDENSIIVFSYIGFESKEVLVGSQKELQVGLVPDLKSLEEIVVVGYGTQKRSDLTGAVGSVKGEEIQNIPARNLAEAIQGRVAGVQITKGSGAPGSGADIIIRGAGSINGLSPLFIVDGVRMGTGNNFNLQDIESIEVLKDASSAAIYGAQAAGGVILVTTKRGGKNQKLQVNANARYGVRQPTNLYDLLGTPDFIRAKRAAGWDFDSWNNPNALPNTDWVDETFRNGKEQSYNISLSGGSEKTNFYLSGNYEREDGIKIDNYFERFSVRLNSDIKLSKKFTIGETLLAWKTFENPAESGKIPVRSVPTMNVYDPTNLQGGWGKHPAEGYFEGPNPVADELVHHRKNDRFAIEGNIYFDWKIVSGLSFRTTLGATIGSASRSHFQEAWDFGSLSRPNAEFEKNFRNNEFYTANFVFTYDKTWGKHGFKAMAGYEALKSKSTDLWAKTAEFPVDVAESFNLSTQSSRQASGGIGNGRVLSQFGRINYNYAGKYLLQASIRRDGSDKFGPQNKWGVFPSFSAGWRIVEENFMQSVSAISDLKVRASYGTLGNDNIGQFLYEPAYANLNLHSFDETNRVSGWGINKFPNSSIKWEELRQTDIGIDLGLFGNALTFTFDWYDRRTTDMLYQIEIPVSSGIGNHNNYPSKVPVNLGEIRNSGLEFAMNYRKSFGEFKLDIGGNISFNNNEVKKLGEGNIPIFEGRPGEYWDASVAKTEEGYAMGQFWGFVVEKVFESDAEVEQLNNQAPDGIYQFTQTGQGDLKFKDLDGDGKITSEDKTYIGNPWPKVIYGITTRMEWKGFDLNILLQGVSGVDLFNGASAYTQNFIGDYNTTSDVFGASFFDGNGVTGQPRLGYFEGEEYVRDPNGNFKNPSSYFVENGSYLKLKNLQFGYTLPESILSKAGIQTMRLYFNGQNLLTFSGYSGLDPEIAGGVKSRGIDNINLYPRTRMYALGLQLGF